MKVNQLKYFLAIVEAGSLSAAAQSLGVAQPALSQHIANLEHELEVLLLERSPRGVSSTPAGDLLYEHARTIIRQFERAESDVRHLGHSPSGEIVVVVAASVAQIVAPSLAREVAERLPEVNLLIQEGMSINLARLVESGRADLAFVPSAILPSGVESEQILTEDLALGGARGEEGDSPGPIDFEEACRFPLVLPSLPHYVRNTLEQVAFDQGVRLNIKAEQDSPRLLPRLVASGYAYSILPENGFFEDQKLDSIFTRRIAKPDISRSLHIIWPKAASQDRLTVEVKSVMREVITALSISGHLRGSLKVG